MAYGYSNNVIQDRKVIEERIVDILETSLDGLQFMTIDRDLAQNAGMLKEIVSYTYEGAVEAVAEGATNTERGKVTIQEKEYRVQVKQQVFDYTDEQYMKDPMVAEVGAKGMAIEMRNDMTNDFFVEIAKTNVKHSVAALGYDAVVDAIAKMELEKEEGLFLLINPDQKAVLRKDEDFVGARLGEIVFDGQIGSVAGVPIVVSKKVPEGKAYLATREAVVCFMKKESEVEAARDAERRINTEIVRKVCLVALVDETKAVEIVIGG